MALVPTLDNPHNWAIEAARRQPAGPAGFPDRPREALLELVVETSLDLGTRLGGRGAPLAHGAQRRQDVVRLRLEHVDDRGVAEVDVRSVEQEEVREARHGRAEVRLRAAAPVLGQRPSVTAAEDPR